MLSRRRPGADARWLMASAGLAVGLYATYAGLTWYRYGRAEKPTGIPDAELDRFMPAYDVVERHQARIKAPPETVWAAIPEMRIQESLFLRALIRIRELMLGGKSPKKELPSELIAQMKVIGWSALSEVPGREIIFGAAAKPWDADPQFRTVSASEFADFRQPGYVKIVWTLRVDPICPDQSVFSTETRAMPTDFVSRAKFRRYWAVVLPGIKVIRRILARSLKIEAERRAARPGEGAVMTHA